MSKLDDVQLRHTAIGDRIVLARVGKNRDVALETRDVKSEFLQAVVSFVFDAEMPKPGDSSGVRFGSGDEQFLMTVERLPPGAPR